MSLPPRSIERLLDVAREGEPGAAGASDERYELRRELGRGGMGVVWEAWDRELARPVALKVLTGAAELSADARERFLREARAAARLAHPGIAAIYDASPGRIAMQLVEGRTLAELGTREPRLVARLLRDAALAAHYAHQHGVVHRDLKPANLMVAESDGGPRLIVTDFGLAKEASTPSSVSVSGSVVGTPAYMAPEQAAGRTSEVGPRSDVYALGATLYDALAGRPPLDGADVYQLLRMAVEREPEPLTRVAPDVPRELATIAHKCLAKDPDERYADARALADDLDRWLAGEPIRARPPTALYRARKFVARRRLVLGAGAGAAFVVALLLVPQLLTARADRSAAERALAVSRAAQGAAERSLALGREVASALADAEAYRRAGTPSSATHERLQVAVDACRAQLGELETAHARAFLGDLLRAQTRYEGAEAAYERALELDPTLQSARFGLGWCLAVRWRDRRSSDAASEALRERARGLLGEALGAETSRTDLLFAESLHALLEGDDERAEALLQQTLELDRTFLEAYRSLSRLAYDAGNDALGLRYAVNATDILRGFGRVYSELGTVPLRPDESPHVRLEGVDGLLVDVAAEGFSASNDALSYAAQAQFQARRAAEWAASGALEESLEAWALAAELYGSALSVDPRSAAAYANRGLCFLQRDLGLARARTYGTAAVARASARADLDEAVRLAPELAAARANRGLLARREGELWLLAFDGPRGRAALDAAALDLERALDELSRDWPERAALEAALAAVDG